MITFGEEGIWWEPYFEYSKNKVHIVNHSMYTWVQDIRIVYLLVIIGFVAVIIFLKRNGNGKCYYMPKPKKENIWGWVQYLRCKFNEFFISKKGK